MLDARMILNNLVQGIKNIIFVLIKFHRNGINNDQSEEIKLFIDLFKYGIDCFPIFTIGPEASQNEAREVSTLTKLTFFSFWEILHHYFQVCHQRYFESFAQCTFRFYLIELWRIPHTV